MKPVLVLLPLRLHPQILFLASEESVVGRNVLLVEDSQGGLPDIWGPEPRLWVSVSLPSRLDQLGGLGALGDQPLNQASPDEPKVKLREVEFPVRPLHISGI